MKKKIVGYLRGNSSVRSSLTDIYGDDSHLLQRNIESNQMVLTKGHSLGDLVPLTWVSRKLSNSHSLNPFEKPPHLNLARVQRTWTHCLFFCCFVLVFFFYWVKEDSFSKVDTMFHPVLHLLDGSAGPRNETQATLRLIAHNFSRVSDIQIQFAERTTTAKQSGETLSDCSRAFRRGERPAIWYDACVQVSKLASLILLITVFTARGENPAWFICCAAELLTQNSSPALSSFSLPPHNRGCRAVLY